MAFYHFPPEPVLFLQVFGSSPFDVSGLEETPTHVIRHYMPYFTYVLGLSIQMWMLPPMWLVGLNMDP